MENTPQIKIGLGIFIKPLLTEEELLPIENALAEKGITLEHKYIERGAQASLDLFSPVVALYISSEAFRSLIQSGMYDVFKFYFLSICKTVSSRKFFRLQSGKKEEKQASLTLIVGAPDKQAVYFNYSGNLTESDKEKAFDCLKTAIENIQPTTELNKLTVGAFNTELEQWKIQTAKEIFQELREKQNLMKEIKITEKEKLIELLQGALANAGILNKEVSKKADEIHNQLGGKKITTEKAYMKKFDKALAEFILSKYEYVIITPAEKVLGHVGDKNEELFDGNDTKVYLDALP